jgi:hypothetical protein
MKKSLKSIVQNYVVRPILITSMAALPYLGYTATKPDANGTSTVAEAQRNSGNAQASAAEQSFEPYVKAEYGKNSDGFKEENKSLKFDPAQVEKIQLYQMDPDGDKFIVVGLDDKGATVASAEKEGILNVDTREMVYTVKNRKGANTLKSECEKDSESFAKYLRKLRFDEGQTEKIEVYRMDAEENTLKVVALDAQGTTVASGELEKAVKDGQTGYIVKRPVTMDTMADEVLESGRSQSRRQRRGPQWEHDRDRAYIGGGAGSTKASITRDDGILVEDKQSTSDFNLGLEERFSVGGEGTKALFDTGFYKSFGQTGVLGYEFLGGVKRKIKNFWGWLALGYAGQKLSGDNFDQTTGGLSIKLGGGNNRMEFDGLYSMKNGTGKVVYDGVEYPFDAKGFEMGVLGRGRVTPNNEVRGSIIYTKDDNSALTAFGVGYSRDIRGKGYLVGADLAYASGTGVSGSDMSSLYVGGSVRAEDALGRLFSPFKKMIDRAKRKARRSNR